jgi:O-antigen/teichoic acid export membrane protein
MQKEFSILRSLRWILIIILIFLFYILQTNIISTLFSFLITEIILLVYSLVKVNKLLSFHIKKEIYLENIKFGIKSFSAEIFAVFNEKFDLLIIGYFLTNSEVGIYSFFIFFSKALYIFPGILQQNLNPIISKHWIECTIKELELKLKKIIRINFLVLIFQTAFTIIFYFILTKYFKQDFKNTTYLLLISIVGIFPSALISWSGSLLIMTGKLKENLIRTIIIMISSLIITFIFTNLYGLIGASIAVALSSIISFILMYTIIKGVLGIKIIQ